MQAATERARRGDNLRSLIEKCCMTLLPKRFFVLGVYLRFTSVKRRVGSVVVGYLHGCLKTRQHDNEQTAWDNR